MPTVTQNYGIKKPIKGEKYDIATINENADIIDESIKEVDDRISNIIAQSGTSSTEVVDARGGFTVLKDRLDANDVDVMGTKVKATNLVTNGDFSNGITGWSASTPVTVANNEASFTQTATNQGIHQMINIPSGHKCYVTCKVFGSSTLLALELQKNTTPWTSFATKAHSAIAQYENLTLILTGTSTTNDVNIRIRDTASSGWALTKVKEVIAINLTATFGAGNEPTKEQMDWIFTERDRLALPHLNGTAELLPMVSLLNLINKKANITQEAWITPTLLNGWVALDASRYPQYMKDTLGFVHLQGACKSGTIGSNIFTLPIGYRPQMNIQYPIVSNGAFGIVYIESSGIVTVPVGSNVRADINNITFKAV